jgi:hypothetical protein
MQRRRSTTLSHRSGSLSSSLLSPHHPWTPPAPMDVAAISPPSVDSACRRRLPRAKFHLYLRTDFRQRRTTPLPNVALSGQRRCRTDPGQHRHRSSSLAIRGRRRSWTPPAPMDAAAPLLPPSVDVAVDISYGLRWGPWMPPPLLAGEQKAGSPGISLLRYSANPFFRHPSFSDPLLVTPFSPSVGNPTCWDNPT